ncbi:TPA: sensor domain-containing diguanylate cyclase [Enterobacter hormaechei subsp. xiangfangensis]
MLTTYISNLTTAVPYLFYCITVVLLTFYILIPITISLKYLSDKRCLFLVPITCAFLGSAMLIIQGVISYPDVFLCGIISSIKYNDFLIYYFHRNALTIFLIILSAFLYRFRSHSFLSNKSHAPIIFVTITITLVSVASALISSGTFLDESANYASKFTAIELTLWQIKISKVMLVAWGISLLFLIYLTKLINLFWVGVCIYIIFYILTFTQLLFTDLSKETNWYQARLFETLSTFVFIIVIYINAFNLFRKSNSKFQDAYHDSIHDYLTQVFNKRYFFNTLASFIRQTSKNNPLTIIICDIDHFKSFNDKYGHNQGDQVIQYVAWKMHSLLRKNDIIARIGGEEFALLLPGTQQQHALDIAERIRLAINENINISSKIQLPEPVSISMGIYTVECNSIGDGECVNRADEALYQAKRAGRNRVMRWEAFGDKS